MGKKLISCGISGKVLRVIFNMYKSIKSCVMVNGMQSEFFESHVGLIIIISCLQWVSAAMHATAA